VRHAFEAIQHFDGFFGVTYASLWLLLISWSHQMRFGARGLVYHQFLKNFDPFGSFSSAIFRIGAEFRGQVLLVWGEKDTLVPHHLCSQWKKAIPAAELWTIPGADHNVPLQQPAMLREAFDRFLVSTTDRSMLLESQSATGSAHNVSESPKVA